MKNFIFATFLILTSHVYANEKCFDIANISPEAKAKFLEAWNRLNAEAKERDAIKAEEKRIAQEKANAEYAANEKEKKLALKSVKNFTDWSRLSHDTKMEVIKWYGRKDMTSYKTEVISKDLNIIQDPAQKAYLKKALKAVDDTGGFNFEDGRGNEVATVGKMKMTADFAIGPEGKILGVDIRALQKIVYTGGDEGIPTHFKTEKEAEEAGFEWAGESYIGHAYFDEKAKIMEFEPMSYDH